MNTRHREKPKNDEPAMNWTHIAAMNLIADHKAGIVVNSTRLAAANALMADYNAARARISAEAA